AEILKSSVSGSLVLQNIATLKATLLDLTGDLLNLRKDNNHAIESISLQDKYLNHNIEKKTEETDIERSRCSGPDMKADIAELQSMKEPVSILIDVMVVFGELANRMKDIDMKDPVSVLEPEHTYLSATLDFQTGLEKSLQRLLEKSAAKTGVPSDMHPNDATTAVPSRTKPFPTSLDTAETIRNHTTGASESKSDPESWVMDPDDD
ncbi:uncharacterized protein PV07_12575, partial [Cladophialophora immunda]